MEYSVNLYSNFLRKIPNEISAENNSVCGIPRNAGTVPNEELVQVINNETGKQQVFPLKQMKFSVKSVIYTNQKTGYSVLSGEIISYQDGNEMPPAETVKICGPFYNIYKDSQYASEGYWGTGKDGSTIFFLTAYSQIKNSSMAVIEEYLRNILKGLSIGPITIKKILDKYGINAIDKLKENPDEDKPIIKNKAKRTAISERLTDQEEKEKALSFLIQSGFSVYLSMRIIEKFGTMTYSKIKGNPNNLFDISEINITAIDSISIREGFKYNNPKRISGMLERYIRSKENLNGDIYVDYESFFKPRKITTKNELSDEADYGFLDFVFANGRFKTELTEDQIRPALNEALMSGKLVSEPMVSDKTKLCVYRSYYNFAENQIVEILKNLITEPTMGYIGNKEIEKFILKYEKTNSISIDPKQCDAVKQALQKKISIISGGPGTGKTQITKLITDIFLKTFPDRKIKLCAPTGKASRRMNEVISLPAQTIHKTLNYLPFSPDSITDIECDLLIIDEVSMVDIDLFHKILSHIKPQTSIVLIGDYNQIPSVGPGLILRDLIDSKKIPTTILTKVFRQSNGSSITSAAYDVLNNIPENIKDRENNSDFIFYNTSSTIQTTRIIEKYIEKMLSCGISPDDIQILTPLNNGPTGVSGLNSLGRTMFNPDWQTKPQIELSPIKTFCRDDRVLQTKNNYDLETFNGSIGKIKSIDDIKDEAIIEFQEEDKLYSKKDMRDLQLGYAITVHKSQGSEFPYVIMPITKENSYVNNRNLLYTAITRARKKFILVGTRDELNAVCGKIHHFSRKSQIKEKLMLP